MKHRNINFSLLFPCDLEDYNSVTQNSSLKVIVDSNFLIDQLTFVCVTL